MRTYMLMPWLVILIAAIANTPTNIYQICAWNVGTLEIEPWRRRSATALKRIQAHLRAWLASIWSPRLGFACLALLIALLLAHSSLASAGVLLAFPPAPAAAGQTVEQLQERRATLLREADALKKDGAFPDDAARTAFDKKLTEVEEIDTQIRQLQPAQPAQPRLPIEPSVNVEQVRDRAIADERARVAGITNAVRIAKLEPTVAEDLIRRGVSLDAARAEIFTKLAAAQEQNPTRQHIVPGGDDARDKWVRGAVNWLLVRSGYAALVAKHEKVEVGTIDPGEFRGLSLLDLAKESLERAGQTVRGLSRLDLAGQAMSYRANYQTTSDFANLLENVMHKILRAAYVLQTDTWSQWCGTASVSDFRTQNWYRLGSLTSLDSLNEHGEFKNKAIPDAEKATYSVGTKGNIIGITREVIVNDDLGAVTRLTEMLGRAGKLTIEKAAYALLGQNSGLGPTQSDSQPLFHANRSNVNATASAITVAGIDADRVIMASQKDPNGQDYIDLRPSVLLVPVGKGSDARTINEALYDPADNKFQKPNVCRGLFSIVVDTPRLSGTRRYLFADTGVAPVFLVSFLEGMQQPVLEAQDGWRFNGVEMKARLDFGVDVVDYRGAVTNAGA